MSLYATVKGLPNNKNEENILCHQQTIQRHRLTIPVQRRLRHRVVLRHQQVRLQARILRLALAVRLRNRRPDLRQNRRQLRLLKVSSQPVTRQRRLKALTVSFLSRGNTCWHMR